MPTTQPAPTTISVAECWELLRSGHLGRVVLPTQPPDIVAVSYAVDQHRVVLRTEDPRLAKLLKDGGAVFEADGVHGDVGWTVTVIEPDQVTGRRFPVGARTMWGWD
jgi:hypothetical protein